MFQNCKLPIGESFLYYDNKKNTFNYWTHKISIFIIVKDVLSMRKIIFFKYQR